MFIVQSDSITQDTMVAVQSPKAYPSLIQQNLHSGDMVAVERLATEHPFWIAGLLIACFISLAWGRIFYVRRLEMIFRAVSAKNYANQLIREGNIFNERIGLVFFVIYLAMISLFVYLSIPLFSIYIPDIHGSLLYLAIAAFFLVFWLIKVIVSRALSLLFNTGENARELLANMFLFNLAAGILILRSLST